MKLRARVRLLRAALTGRAVQVPVATRHAAAVAGGRLLQDWAADRYSANDQLRWTLADLRAKSRQLVEDNGEAAGALLDFETDLAGPKGVRLQFRARSPRGIVREALNDQIETAWAAWGRRGHCTVDGYEDWPGLCRLLVRTVVADGEFLALRVRDARALHGYTLQVLDPDQLDETKHELLPDGRRIVMGVELDRNGRPIAYHLWDRHPNDAGRVRRRVPAADVLHVFKRLRPGQVRGIPWFAPALLTWKLGDRYTEAELYQSLLAAAQGGFFESADGDVASVPTQLNPETGQQEPVPITMEAEPGTARMLPPGWTFKPWQPTHPTANYVGFMKAVKRTIARAIGRAYNSLTGDLEAVNFSSMRVDRVREVEQNKVHQHDLLVAQFADVVFADWVEMAELAGAFTVTGVGSTNLTTYAAWMLRGYPWIDPAKDAAANEVLLKHGLTSRQILCAERGVDFFDVIDQLREERKYAQAAGVELGAADVTTAIVASADDADPSDSTTPDGARAVRLLRGAA